MGGDTIRRSTRRGSIADGLAGTRFEVRFVKMNAINEFHAPQSSKSMGRLARWSRGSNLMKLPHRAPDEPL